VCYVSCKHGSKENFLSGAKLSLRARSFLKAAFGFRFPPFFLRRGRLPFEAVPSSFGCEAAFLSALSPRRGPCRKKGLLRRGPSGRERRADQRQRENRSAGSSTLEFKTAKSFLVHFIKNPQSFSNYVFPRCTFLKL
jgi:hypothetical protein